MTEAETSPLTIENAGRGLRRFILSRPERGNALNSALIQALLSGVQQADASTRLIVLRGAGKHFCSGGEIGAASNEGGPRLSDLLLGWDEAPRPTIAFVHGACLGAAVALAACCDMVVAAPDAFFAIPEIRLGMTPGLLPFFIRAVGERSFRRYGLSGERFGTDAALRCGLVSEIAPVAEWDGVERRIQDAFLEAAPLTLARLKKEARRYADPPITADTFATPARHETDETAEGKAAFKERRKPSWWIEP